LLARNSHATQPSPLVARRRNKKKATAKNVPEKTWDFSSRCRSYQRPSFWCVIFILPGRIKMF